MAELTIGVPMNFEPLRNNRFVVEFPTELGIETWKVRKYKAPKFTQNIVELPFINETQYVHGRYKWETITIEFIATIGPSTTSQLMEWVRLHSESLTGRQGYSKGAKKDIILKNLDPTGVEVDKWTCEQCVIVDVDFGQRDMGDDEVQIYTMTVQPYRCIHHY